jgi:hypothetical protein
MRRSRTSSTRAPCTSARPPALSTERLSRSRMAWWSCSAGGGQRWCPRGFVPRTGSITRSIVHLDPPAESPLHPSRHRVAPLRLAPLVPSAGYCAGVVGGERDSASAVALRHERLSASPAPGFWNGRAAGLCQDAILFDAALSLPPSQWVIGGRGADTPFDASGVGRGRVLAAPDRCTRRACPCCLSLARGEGR